MPKLYTTLVEEVGNPPYVLLSTQPLPDEFDAWGEYAVKVELVNFYKQPDASIMEGIVRNIFANAGFEVVMSSGEPAIVRTEEDVPSFPKDEE